MEGATFAADPMRLMIVTAGTAGIPGLADADRQLRENG